MPGNRMEPRTLFVIALCAIGLLLLGAAVLKSGQSTEVAVEPTSNEPVVARVNGKSISEADLLQIKAQKLAGGADDPDPEILIQALIDQRLLADEANRLNLAEDRETQSRLRLAKEQILANALLEKTAKDAVTEEKLQRLYQEQSSLRQRGVEIRARQILLPDRETADEVIKKLERGDAFPALAVAYSLDRVSRESGGDLGFFTRDSYPEEFSNPVFATPVGQRAALFETSRGWHIVEVSDRRQAPVPQFEDVKDDLEIFLRAQAIEKLMSDLKVKAEIELIPEARPHHD